MSRCLSDIGAFPFAVVSSTLAALALCASSTTGLSLEPRLLHPAPANPSAASASSIANRLRAPGVRRPAR
jgi:hypothetical protein